MTQRRLSLYRTAILAVTGFTLLASSAAYAFKPLVIIRFNQRNVYYERPLFSAIERAVQVKPDVRFDVVAISPKSPNTGTTKKMAQITKAKAAEVMHSMEKMGIPKERIAFQMEYADTLRTSEVHVFVK